MFEDVAIDNKVLLSKEIIRLSNELDEKYRREFNFRNHCYLRIAYDNTVNNKWDTLIAKPFVKNTKEEQLKNTLLLLKNYLSDKAQLLKHNKVSLKYREKNI